MSVKLRLWKWWPCIENRKSVQNDDDKCVQKPLLRKSTTEWALANSDNRCREAQHVVRYESVISTELAVLHLHQIMIPPWNHRYSAWRYIVGIWPHQVRLFYGAFFIVAAVCRNLSSSKSSSGPLPQMITLPELEQCIHRRPNHTNKTSRLSE